MYWKSMRTSTWLGRQHVRMLNFLGAIAKSADAYSRVNTVTPPFFLEKNKDNGVTD
jgi:hypothetical protein